MPNDEITDTHITLREIIPNGVRILLAIMGLIAVLLVPYEFLIRPKWEGVNMGLIVSIPVCIGAIIAGVFLLAAGLFGLNKTLIFDKNSASLHYYFESTFLPLRKQKYAFGEIEQISIITHDWTDGPSTYALIIHIFHGRQIESGNYKTLEEAQNVQYEIENLLGKIRNAG